ncbi:MAG: hypothetical protein KAZ14_00140 [Nitrosomonas sp.]|nr:hypothetical protein [Nitrosomonas sp.]
MTKNKENPIDRPILFSAPMVRAILDGRKTQTRRVVNRLKKHGVLLKFGKSDTKGYEWSFRDRKERLHDVRMSRLLELCPYGNPGDRLWVRETFAKVHDESGFINGYVEFKASCLNPQDWEWTPSIHMHRYESRILLETTDIRVEKLHDISEEDAIAEGAVGVTCNCIGEKFGKQIDQINSFRNIWESINGIDSWDLNPFVWVIKFRKI